MAWAVLQNEANQSAEYLGQELESLHGVLVERAGEGSVDGTTRRFTVQQEGKN